MCACFLTNEGLSKNIYVFFFLFDVVCTPFCKKALIFLPIPPFLQRDRPKFGAVPESRTDLLLSAIAGHRGRAAPLPQHGDLQVQGCKPEQGGSSHCWRHRPT